MVWRGVREEVLLQGISGGTLTRRLESGSNVGYLLRVCTSRRGLVQTAPPYHRCTLLWLRATTPRGVSQPACLSSPLLPAAEWRGWWYGSERAHRLWCPAAVYSACAASG